MCALLVAVLSSLQVFTFDPAGVSGHPNHRATSLGVQQLYSRRGGSDVEQEAPLPPLYLLQSISVWRKYLGLLGVAGTLVAGAAQAGFQFVTSQEVPKALVLVSHHPTVNHRAMQAHRSQYVWYRRLFVIFSQYTFVNRLLRADQA